MRLWTGSDLCFSRSLTYSVSLFSDIFELDQRFGRNGTELVQARRLESSNERDGVYGKIKDPELIVLSFRGHLHSSLGGKRQGPPQPS